MSPSPPEASRRTVTVLFCDVVDSTPLGEALDPELLRRVMAAYYASVRGVLERHGGTVEKFIGDAVMAVFGIPTLHEDDALRAVRAASELAEAVAPELRVRVGVATGEVVASDPSGGQAFATGETVVTAERLEAAARPGDVLLDDATYRLVADAVDAEPVEAVAAKGKARPIGAWRLLGVRPGALGVARRLDTPLVGRRGELAALRQEFDRAVAERRCRLIAVLGPAGIGKSRLVREFLVEAGPQATVRVGRCPPYGDGITFWPIAEVLPDETLEGTTDEIFWRVRKQFERLAREQPLVLCFEDVHWAEPTFLNLVEYLHGLIGDAPVLLLCLARPELLDHRPEWMATGVTLAPLSEPEADALLGALGAPEEARRRIAEAAEGNPLFAEQMAAMAAEEGPAFVVPPSIRTLLAARLDRLPAGERAVVERASVIGREFPLRAVAALAPEELRPEVTDHLFALVRKDLVEPHVWAFGDEDGFRFRHGLIRDAGYEAIPKELRAELHERYARWSERYSGEDVIVGYHLEQAFRLRRELGEADEGTLALARAAGEQLAEAGERAYRRDDVPAAVTLLERAVSLLPPDSARWPDLSTELASALIKAGRLESAEKVLEQALEAARRSGDRRSELRATIERHYLRAFTAPAGGENLARAAAETIPELERLGDDLGLAKAWRLASEVHVIACRWRARAEALERALEHARRVPEARHEASMIRVLLAQALHYGPTPAPDAIAQCSALLAEADGDPALEAGVGATLAALLATQGRFEEARERYARSISLYEELGLRFRRATRTLEGAEIESLAGDLDAAERELRLGHDLLEAMGETGVRSVVAAYLAGVLCDRGDDEEAERLAQIAAELAEDDDLASHVAQRTTRAQLLARRGDPERGEAVAREALELAAGTDFPAMHADALVALANVLALSAREGEASELLERARRIYEEKGNVVAASRLAGRLRELVP